MKSFLSLLLAVMLPATLLFAGEIKTGQNKTALTYSAQGFEKITFQSTVSSVQFREVNTSQGPFTELFILNHVNASAQGEPNMPTTCRLIEVPLNKGFTIEIIHSEYKDYNLKELGALNPVIPVQPSLSKGVEDPGSVPFAFKQDVYSLDRLTSLPLVSVNPAGIMRSINLAQLVVSPLQYNPVTGQLRIYHKIEASIRFVEADIQATRELKNRFFSPYFSNFSRLTDNDFASDSMLTASPATFVIISPPEFETALQPLVRWKTRKGFRVIEGYTNNPAVGNTTASIKDYLQALYLNPPQGFLPPSFALFVGDVAQIPAWMNNGQATDLRYCEYTGDNLPEVIYGRFSAINAQQVQSYVDKTTRYEQYLIPDDSYLNEDVMIAGYDAGGNGLTFGNGQINYGNAYYFNSAHNLTSHTFLQPEPAGANYSQQIRDHISAGVCYANYTAHGSESGWADPEFTISQIPALQNLDKYCLMVGNCCLTSKFNLTSFAEEVTRATGKGAVGYIGASNNSYWDEDFWWGCGLKAISTSAVYDPQHLGAYDVTFHDHGEPSNEWFTTMGQMFVGGNMAVEQSNSSLKQYYWEIYNLMGDPSLSIYYSVPQPVTATLPQVLLVGTGNCEVTTEPWAYVALSLNDSTLLDAGCADSTGIVALNYPALTVPQFARFVITKQNRKPMIDSVMIIQPNGPYITTGTVSVNDSLQGNNNKKAEYDETVSLRLTIHNVGLAQAGNLTATISTSDTNVLIINSSFTFGAVPSDTTLIEENAFQIKIKNNVADQHKVNFTLTYADGANTWPGACSMILNAPVITVGTISVTDPLPGGNNNGILDPGETAQLKVRINNNGHAPVSNTHALMQVMQGSTGFVLLNNSSTFVGNIAVNGVGYAIFTVVANGITPLGTTVNFSAEAIAGQYNQFSAGAELQLVIGQPAQYPMSNTTFSACNGVFFDAGGPTANYPNNQDLVMTIHAGSPGAKLRLTFTEFNVESHPDCSYDYLNVYNGPSMMDPLIGSFCGTNLPSTITSTSSVGSLTFLFHSDFQHNFPGWAATLQCMGGPMNMIANSFPQNVCEGGSSQLVAMVNGGSGNYTYEWTPATYLDDPHSATPIATPGENISYTVTVSDGTNLLTSSPITLTVLSKPAPPVISQSGDLLISDATTGNQWYINGNLIPGATGQTYAPSASGNYTASVSDAINGCISNHSNYITWLITGQSQSITSPKVRVYPSPATDVLVVEISEFTAGSTTISLADAFGRTVIHRNSEILQGAQATKIALDVLSLKPGVYFLTVSSNHESIIRKVLITK